uniref:Uncharacterized protein n=1 Tax=Arundo donax TaxID=35708 RepID=A0A0A9AAI1_ARUDO
MGSPWCQRNRQPRPAVLYCNGTRRIANTITILQNGNARRKFIKVVVMSHSLIQQPLAFHHILASTINERQTEIYKAIRSLHSCGCFPTRIYPKS